MRERAAGIVNGTGRDPLLIAFAATALFLALGTAGVMRHEMWRDEVQVWLIAQASPSVADLLHNVRHETHPALWHLTVWLLTRLTQSLRAFQFLHLALAALGVFLLWRFAPFRRWEKLLLTLGYFSLFEYGVVARNYVMGVVLVYAFCAAYPRGRRGLAALFLFLLAQTSLHGAIVAAGLALFVATAPAEPGSSGRQIQRQRILPSLLAAGAGILLCGIQVSTAYTPNRYAPAPLGIERVLDVLQGFERSFLPIPDPGGKPVWGSNIVPDLLARAGLGDAGVRAATAAVSVAIAILAAAALLRRRRALAFFVAAAATLLAFGIVVYQGAIRHHGHLFVAFIAALWLARDLDGAPEDEAPPAAAGRLASLAAAAARRAIPVIFAAQAAAGLLAWGLDIARPFSLAPETARFIRAERLDALPLFGDRAPPASSLQPYLDGPITYLADGRRGGYIVWGPGMWSKIPDPGRMWANFLRETLGAPRKEALLILNYPLEKVPSRFRIREVRRFTGSLVGDEDYFLYAIRWEN